MKGREDEPIYLDSHSLILRLLQMIRDETHREVVQLQDVGLGRSSGGAGIQKSANVCAV